jgi:O-antigen ligase
MVTGVIFVVTLLILQRGQIDVFVRFRVTTGFEDAWRSGEYGSIVNVLIEQPMGFLTGQGFGALHTVAGRTIPFFHNEYLQNIFSIGIIGFACYCYIIFSTIMRGRQLCEDRQMALILMPVRITFFALAGMALYFPVLWSTKNSTLVIAFAAISRNAYWFVSQESDQLYDLSDGEELTLVQDYGDIG